MLVQVNGEAKQIVQDASPQDLLSLMALSNKGIAIEVNQQILLRSEFAQHKFKEGDKIEIVTAIGGG